ncbi:hypothetical protein J2Z65_002279 [Paenibacillus aceris]|uniref:Uncharacterized protein n=1 Tax=Paenibacillus aceris TaxID=869555 RepID=A0ABS4HWQ8_9BACL|nr:hypothetical protein [Paenibacillus aceris]
MKAFEYASGELSLAIGEQFAIAAATPSVVALTGG